jgi:hypothetical protein
MGNQMLFFFLSHLILCSMPDQTEAQGSQLEIPASIPRNPTVSPHRTV